MMRKRLWAEEENQELVNKYGDNVLFKSLSVIGLQCSGMAKNFALSKSELFYHVLFSLDEIRGYEDKNERIDYCKSLWNDIYEYLSCKVDAEETDLRNAASLVTLAVCNCINISGLLIYHDEVYALLKSNAKGNPDALKLCFSWFQDFQNSVKNQKVRQWLREYFEGDSFLSDEISQELDCLRQEAEQYKKQQELLANAKIDCYYAPGSVHNDNRRIMNVEVRKQKQINNTENEQQYLQ